VDATGKKKFEAYKHFRLDLQWSAMKEGKRVEFFRPDSL